MFGPDAVYPLINRKIFSRGCFLVQQSSQVVLVERQFPGTLVSDRVWPVQFICSEPGDQAERLNVPPLQLLSIRPHHLAALGIVYYPTMK